MLNLFKEQIRDCENRQSHVQCQKPVGQPCNMTGNATITGNPLKDKASNDKVADKGQDAESISRQEAKQY